MQRFRETTWRFVFYFLAFWLGLYVVIDVSIILFNTKLYVVAIVSILLNVVVDVGVFLFNSVLSVVI